MQQGVPQVERLPYPTTRYTKYFWTINTQRAAYTRQQAEILKELIRKAVLDVFISGECVAFAHPNHEYNTIYIGANELQLSVEIGPKKGRVHLHMIQHLAHRTMLNIDPSDVKDKVENKLEDLTGQPMIIFVSKTSHPSEKPLLAYIDKERVNWGVEGLLPHGIWTYSFVRSPLDKDWVCSHPDEVIDGRTQDIGSGQFVQDNDFDDDYDMPDAGAPAPAPAPPVVRRPRQPEWMRLQTGVNLTPRQAIRTDASTVFQAAPPARGRGVRLPEWQRTANEAANFLNRGRGR